MDDSLCPPTLYCLGFELKINENHPPQGRWLLDVIPY